MKGRLGENERRLGANEGREKGARVLLYLERNQWGG